jgi:hypothetical protein
MWILVFLPYVAFQDDSSSCPPILSPMTHALQMVQIAWRQFTGSVLGYVGKLCQVADAFLQRVVIVQPWQKKKTRNRIWTKTWNIGLHIFHCACNCFLLVMASSLLVLSVRIVPFSQFRPLRPEIKIQPNNTAQMTLERTQGWRSDHTDSVLVLPKTSWIILAKTLLCFNL